jgi:glycosyltransferase 2 family protein
MPSLSKIATGDGPSIATRRMYAVLKVLLPMGLFGFLLWNVDPQEYQVFWQQPKRWWLLFSAQFVALLAFTLSFLRWRMLVRAFDIPFSVKECLRLGFLGHLLNFVSFGSVGGDLFKAVLVARDKPQRRPEAVASVLVDRAIGLLGLIAMAWVSIECFAERPIPPVLAGLRAVSALMTVGAVLGLVLAIYAGPWFDRLVGQFERIPWLGDSLVRMARAVRMLRARIWVVPAMFVVSLLVQGMLSLTVYLISHGIYVSAPGLSEHMMVVPPAMAAGALPIAPGGLGVQEGALAGLFGLLPYLPDGFSGMLVATVYRLVTISIAGIGVVYYMASHGREFRFGNGETDSVLPVN